MQGHTKAIVAAAIGADNTITASRKKQIMFALETEGGAVTENAIPKVYSRDEAGRVLGVSSKRIDQLVKIGAIRKTYAPGTSRAIGITHDSLLALATGRGQGEAVRNV